MMDLRRGVSDPATSEGEDDGGTPGQTGAIPSGYSWTCSLKEGGGRYRQWLVVSSASPPPRSAVTREQQAASWLRARVTSPLCMIV
jgi:hypothetical protein